MEGKWSLKGEDIDLKLNSFRMQSQFYFLVGEAPQMSSKSNSL